MAFRIETALATRLPRDSEGRHTGFRRGEDIDLSDPQIHRQVCVRGFAGPEYDGTWTQEASALLLLQLAEGYDEPAAIWIAGMPFVTERHTQLLDVACDGVGIGQVRLDWARAGRQVLRLVRPQASIGNPWLRIDLRIGIPWSPAQEGLSGDTRPLGIKLGRVAVTAVDAPAPPMFEGQAIDVGAATPTPDGASPPDARARLVDAKLDLIVEELRATRAIADQARASAGRVAAAVDRMLAVPPGGDAG